MHQCICKSISQYYCFRLPIHTAIRYKAPAPVIKLLLQDASSTLLSPGPYNQLPLHVACRNSATSDVIRLLLDSDMTKSAVVTGDEVSRLPIHLALLHTRETKSQLEMVQLLMENMICGRMELRGLDLWKIDLKNVLEGLSTHERDFMTRDKLDMVMECIRYFMERVFVLELAVWRASCLEFGDYLSMEQVLEELSLASISEGTEFDVGVYKADRRIKSGADVIVRDVIPFLEYEAVDDLMSKLNDY